jgi:hypothetical protein
MSSFTSLLVVSPLENGKDWVLRKEFSYDVGYLGSGDTITVPAGFVTDFASVPKTFWGILPRWDKYGQAAVLHDYLYNSLKRSRIDSDKIFLEAMEVLDVPKWKSRVMYQSVRMFGSKHYKMDISRFLPLSGEKIEIFDLKF